MKELMVRSFTLSIRIYRLFVIVEGHLPFLIDRYLLATPYSSFFEHAKELHINIIEE
jgi:hypothetical protein